MFFSTFDYHISGSQEGSIEFNHNRIDDKPQAYLVNGISLRPPLCSSQAHLENFSKKSKFSKKSLFSAFVGSLRDDNRALPV